MTESTFAKEVQNVLNMDPDDYLVVAAALGLILLGSGIAEMVPNLTPVYTHLLGTGLFAAVFGLTLVHRARDLWGGQMQRYMDFIALGAVVHVAVFVPGTLWMLQGSPAWYGISDGAWFVLFHGASMFGVILIARGVYLLWANEVQSA